MCSLNLQSERLSDLLGKQTDFLYFMVGYGSFERLFEQGKREAQKEVRETTSKRGLPCSNF